MIETFTVGSMQELIDDSPFIAFLGLRIDSLDLEAGSVEATLPHRREFERGGPMTGQFHGGVIASLIDVVGDMAVAMKVGGGVPTINFRVDYLRPSAGPALKAHGLARRVGRTVGVADVEVFDAEGRLTAVGRGTYSPKIG